MIEKTKKRRRLIVEILLLIALCFALSLILFLVSVTVSRGLIEEYCFNHDIVMDEFAWYRLDRILVSVGFALSATVFAVLFTALFIDRLAYIRRIIRGVHVLREGDLSHRVKLLGNNELTELAEAVNYLSESERRLKEKEKRLNEEKEELIRTLSHDIRTPLTSIMSYTELLHTKESLTQEEQREYFALIIKKTAQIKELTDILLDGGRREVERFDDARLLFEQLACEFEEALEDTFQLSVTLPLNDAFSGGFDVGELQRIFDNLISNIKKYADPEKEVVLAIVKNESGLVIRQSNAIRQDKQPSESYKMGLNSIRRIAHNYGGTVGITESGERFAITVTLSDI